MNEAQKQQLGALGWTITMFTLMGDGTWTAMALQDAMRTDMQVFGTGKTLENAAQDCINNILKRSADE